MDDGVEIRYVKCTFCGWKHSYDASIIANVNEAWKLANQHALVCESDPRNSELAALRSLLKEAGEALDTLSMNLSDGELELAREVWGNTNTQIVKKAKARAVDIARKIEELG